MAKADLGTKQVCPNCAAKFYDLGRRPAQCPKCEHTFDPETDDPRLKSSAKAEKPAEDQTQEDQDGYGEEAEQTKEIDLENTSIPADAGSDDESDEDLGDDLEDGFTEESTEGEDDTSLLIDDEEEEDFGDISIDKGEEDLA